MMSVKNIFTASIAASLLLTFSSCNNEYEANDSFDSKIKGLTIKATTDNNSRTSFNDGKTVWSEDDKLNILISGENNSTPTVNEFTITNAERAEFSNNEVELNANSVYKFHAIYPAGEINTTSGNATISIGATTLTQSGNSTDHIAALDPLYGFCESTPNAITIPMKHTAAILKLEIKNTTESAISIKEVKVKAPTGVVIAGKHEINIESGTITPTADAANNCAITLSLDEPQTLAANAKHTVWIATAPFTIAKGGSLLFTVVDSNDNEYDVVKSFASGREFKSGVILSTQIPINAVASATTTVTFDFSNSATFPDNAPTSEATAVTALTCSSTPAGYTTDIYAANGCFRSTADNDVGITINSINTKSNSSEYATISLPQIAGHKITTITLENNTASANAYAWFCDKNGEMLRKKILQMSTVTYSSTNLNEDGVNDDSPFYIKFTTDSNKKCKFKSITITYTRM